jgi:hypothetical protein
MTDSIDFAFLTTCTTAGTSAAPILAVGPLVELPAPVTHDAGNGQKCNACAQCSMLFYLCCDTCDACSALQLLCGYSCAL